MFLFSFSSNYLKISLEIFLPLAHAFFTSVLSFSFSPHILDFFFILLLLLISRLIPLWSDGRYGMICTHLDVMTCFMAQNTVCPGERPTWAWEKCARGSCWVTLSIDVITPSWLVVVLGSTPSLLVLCLRDLSIGNRGYWGRNSGFAFPLAVLSGSASGSLALCC